MFEKGRRRFATKSPATVEQVQHVEDIYLAFNAAAGALMYVVEGEENGFTSIPASMYWAVVTLTTVGYGDVTPQTPLGKLLASVVMILGYGIIRSPPES